MSVNNFFHRYIFPTRNCQTNSGMYIPTKVEFVFEINIFLVKWYFSIYNSQRAGPTRGIRSLLKVPAREPKAQTNPKILSRRPPAPILVLPALKAG